MQLSNTWKATVGLMIAAILCLTAAAVVLTMRGPRVAASDPAPQPVG